MTENASTEIQTGIAASHLDVGKAIDEIRSGKMVLLLDGLDEDACGEICMAAARISTEAINTMLNLGRGIVCTPMSEQKMRFLKLDMISEQSEGTVAQMGVSFEASQGVTTGISAADRATTIMAAVNEGARPEDLRRPGHVFPIRVRSGGVLRAPGRSEAAVDLARLAGFPSIAVTCQVLREDGKAARLKDLMVLADNERLGVVLVSDLVQYRLQRETLVRRAGDAKIPTKNSGVFRSIVYENDVDSVEHIALVKGDVRSVEAPLVRLHSECLTGDAFGSLRCDCGDQLESAMQKIDSEGSGVVLYLRQEGRGIGLTNKIRAYGLQDREGLDTVEANLRLGFAADQRDYGVGGQILVDLGIRKVRLLTNNPLKRRALEGLGLDVVEQVPLEIEPNERNRDYLRTKREKLGHSLGFEED